MESYVPMLKAVSRHMAEKVPPRLPSAIDDIDSQALTTLLDVRHSISLETCYLRSRLGDSIGKASSFLNGPQCSV